MTAEEVRRVLAEHPVEILDNFRGKKRWSAQCEGAGCGWISARLADRIEARSAGQSHLASVLAPANEPDHTLKGVHERRMRELPGYAEAVASLAPETDKALSGKRYGVMCIYCGLSVFYVNPSSATDVQAAYEAAKAHDAVCPKNPLVQELKTLRGSSKTGKP